MIHAHQLDRQINIESLTTTQDDYGTVVEAWATTATVRAQRIETRTSDFLRASGEGSESVVVYRIRYTDNINLDDRVTDAGDEFNIKEIVELGRKAGLELRCRRRT